MVKKMELKSYKCKRNGEDFVSVSAFDPQDAAKIFAEEYGVEDGEIVHVWMFGNYKIHVIEEPIFSAEKVSEKKMIPIDECKKNYVYKVMARNFQVAIFDGIGGFIGIRRKFGDRYLAVEYHWDLKGTVHPIEEIGVYEEEIDFYDHRMFEFLDPLQKKATKEREEEYRRLSKK